MINKSRLKVLQARQQMLEEVFNETRSQLFKISQDNAKYRDLLGKSILQGLYQLMDDQVKAIVRKSDIDLAKSAIQVAVQSYKRDTKRDIVVEIDKENNLPDDS